MNGNLPRNTVNAILRIRKELKESSRSEADPCPTTEKPIPEKEPIRPLPKRS